MTLPVVAPFPTVAWISVGVSEVIGAALWPILTFADESKPVPSIVTVVPVMPFSGLNEVIVGPCDCVGSGHTYAPRLRVQAESVVAPRSICRSQIITLGMPEVNFCQTG